VGSWVAGSRARVSGTGLGRSGRVVDTVWVSFDGLSDELVDLLDRLFGPEAVRFRGFAARLAPDEPVLIEESAAARAVRPYGWLLDRLGADGVRLTSAGYLPPVVVTEAVTALGWHERWIGAANREYHTTPVLELRESARRFGLVRKHRGVLYPTKLGRALRADPLSLWWHVAECLPDARSEAEEDAGLLLLVVVASGTPVNTTMLDRLLCKGMAALGWQIARTGEALNDWQAFAAARNTWTALRRLGGLPEDDWNVPAAPATPAGIQLARAALLRRDRRIPPAGRDD
jgi:hypothetical protein